MFCGKFSGGTAPYEDRKVSDNQTKPRGVLICPFIEGAVMKPKLLGEQICRTDSCYLFSRQISLLRQLG